MRVRITAVMKGRIDGINLEHFEVGHVYDVGTSLANYLLASRYAVPVNDERPAPPDERPPAAKDHASDKPRRPRKRR